MSFVIVGGGRVGLRTARILSEEGYEVVLVENDPDKVHRIEEEGFPVVAGDGDDADALEEAGVAEADAVAGLTGDLNVNFAACMIGAEYDVRTVMRIDEDYREEIYETYADEVDEIIYPEQLGAAGAKTALLGGNFNLIADLTADLQLFTVTVTENAPVIGTRVTDLDEKVDVRDARIYAHGRAHEAMTIPMPGTLVEVGDRVAVLAEREAADQVRATLLGDGEEAAA